MRHQTCQVGMLQCSDLCKQAVIKYFITIGHSKVSQCVSGACAVKCVTQRCVRHGVSRWKLNLIRELEFTCISAQQYENSLVLGFTDADSELELPVHIAQVHHIYYCCRVRPDDFKCFPASIQTFLSPRWHNAGLCYLWKHRLSINYPSVLYEENE